MTINRNFETTKTALEALRSYMYNFYPERRTKNPLPLEFWKLDDEFFYDYMNYLPVVFSSELGGLSRQALRHLPEALHILWPIFGLEDAYDCDGWAALANAGSHELPFVIAAYERVGFPAEAAALKAALLACESDPEDTEAAEAAYKSVRREFEEDDDRRMAVIAYMRKNEHLWNSYLDT